MRSRRSNRAEAQVSPTIRFLTWVVWITVAGAVVGALGGFLAAQLLHLPQIDLSAPIELPSATRILAADDVTELATFAAERRIVLKPEEIPPQIKMAIIAAEDERFYSHGGFDPIAIARALFFSVMEGRLGARGGASTLTQQLARNLFLTRERTLSRKIREILLAVEMERKYTKDQIISAYANLVFLGAGAYGVEAAARTYFGKHASELTLSEAALLAGLIQAPNARNPFHNPLAARNRRNFVLSRMLKLGFINREQFRKAVAEPIKLRERKRQSRLGAYFVEEVRKDLERRYGPDALYTQGLEVHTTLEPALQKLAEEAVRQGLVELEKRLGYRRPENLLKKGSKLEEIRLPSWHALEPAPGVLADAVVTEVNTGQAKVKIGDITGMISLESAKWTGTKSLKRILRKGDLVFVRFQKEKEKGSWDVELVQRPSVQAALIAMDNRSGEIRAMVGGFDFASSQFNRAVQAARQCGSAFKPFVYLAAFERGYTPADLLFDAPFLLPDEKGELTYCPKNYYGKYYGMVTLRRALEHSFNATAVKLQQLVGAEAVIEVAKGFGITTPLAPYASMALGALEVKLIDLVRAYAGFANLGESPKPIMVREVRNPTGILLSQYPATEKVAPEAPTYLLVHVLEGVVKRGTAKAARNLPGHLAGKTGTTDDYTDAWFIGFSPRITVGVWVGRDMKKPIGPRMTGAQAALPIWIRFMKSYLESLPEDERQEGFPVPAGVVFSTVDLMTGKRALPGCGEPVLEAFLDGTEPTEECDPELVEVVSNLPWPMQEPFYKPKPGEPMPSREAILVADARLEGKDPKEVLESLAEEH